MDMVFNIGLMVLIMKVNGISIRLKVKELFGMLKVMFTEENLRMIWPMDMENILILTEANIKENLKMMYKKVMERKSG
jgi:hypothetical protein